MSKLGENPLDHPPTLGLVLGCPSLEKPLRPPPTLGLPISLDLQSHKLFMHGYKSPKRGISSQIVTLHKHYWLP
jgi:hypothetical protein